VGEWRLNYTSQLHPILSLRVAFGYGWRLVRWRYFPLPALAWAAPVLILNTQKDPQVVEAVHTSPPVTGTPRRGESLAIRQGPYVVLASAAQYGVVLAQQLDDFVFWIHQCSSLLQ
jgi:hypothetical protein